MSKPVLPDNPEQKTSGVRARTTLLEHRPAAGAFEIKVFSDTATVTTGDGAFIMVVPEDLGGTNLSQVALAVTTVSSSGAPTVQLRNITQAHDMLTTKVSVDASEFTSYTAATPPVINQANAAVATGDRIAVDVDVAGTGAKGLTVMVEFS